MDLRVNVKAPSFKSTSKKVIRQIFNAYAQKLLVAYFKELKQNYPEVSLIDKEDIRNLYEKGFNILAIKCEFVFKDSNEPMHKNKYDTFILELKQGSEMFYCENTQYKEYPEFIPFLYTDFTCNRRHSVFESDIIVDSFIAYKIKCN